MEREITPDGLEGVLEELSYPTLRPDAAAELKEVTLVLDDEEANLGAMISDTGADSFKTPEDLREELDDRMPDLPTR
jgi:hypothetical protein